MNLFTFWLFDKNMILKCSSFIALDFALCNGFYYGFCYVLFGDDAWHPNVWHLHRIIIYPGPT